MPRMIDVLKEIAPIAHFTFWPALDACDEDLSTPPIIWWSYQRPSAELAQFLSRVISAFPGSLEWEFVATDRRWTLMPARVKEYAESHAYGPGLIAATKLKEAEPDFGRCANAELRLLAEHIRQHLEDAGLNPHSSTLLNRHAETSSSYLPAGRDSR